MGADVRTKSMLGKFQLTENARLALVVLNLSGLAPLPYTSIARPFGVPAPAGCWRAARFWRALVGKTW